MGADCIALPVRRVTQCFTTDVKSPDSFEWLHQGRILALVAVMRRRPFPPWLIPFWLEKGSPGCRAGAIDYSIDCIVRSK